MSYNVSTLQKDNFISIVYVIPARVSIKKISQNASRWMVMFIWHCRHRIQAAQPHPVKNPQTAMEDKQRRHHGTWYYRV